MVADPRPQAVSYLIDTGPLLAMLDRRDRNHAWITGKLGQSYEPLLTCESVISESLYLLKRQGLDWEPLIRAILGRMILVDSVTDDQPRIAAILRKYRDLPTSYADASLIVLSERCRRIPLLTTDSDFRVYRRADRTIVPLEMPDGLDEAPAQLDRSV